jgi:hypothetical protein
MKESYEDDETKASDGDLSQKSRFQLFRIHARMNLNKKTADLLGDFFSLSFLPNTP